MRWKSLKFYETYKQMEGHYIKGRIYVNGLSWETTAEDLREYFCNYGEVTDCIVIINSETGLSRGFGFVTFTNPAHVLTVLQAGPHQIKNRIITPKYCLPRRYVSSKVGHEYPKVFLGGLPSITETELGKYFSRFGRVMEVYIVYDHKNKKSRGFGFIAFSAKKSRDACVAERWIVIDGKQVQVKKAYPFYRNNANQKNNSVDNNNNNNMKTWNTNHQTPIPQAPPNHPYMVQQYNEQQIDMNKLQGYNTQLVYNNPYNFYMINDENMPMHHHMQPDQNPQLYCNQIDFNVSENQNTDLTIMTQNCDDSEVPLMNQLYYNMSYNKLTESEVSLVPNNSNCQQLVQYNQEQVLAPQINQTVMISPPEQPYYYEPQYQQPHWYNCVDTNKDVWNTYDPNMQSSPPPYSYPYYDPRSGCDEYPAINYDCQHYQDEFRMTNYVPNQDNTGFYQVDKPPCSQLHPNASNSSLAPDATSEYPNCSSYITYSSYYSEMYITPPCPYETAPITKT